MRYNFYVSNNKVVCVSSFARKAVRGIAKCDPKDAFNEDKGRDLAQLRCDVKIAEKRMKRALSKRDEAIKIAHEAEQQVTRMYNYVEESTAEYHDLKSKLASLEATL